MKKYKIKLKEYVENLKNPNNQFPSGYLEYHETEIDCLEWLIASYEDRAGDPKDYLESLISTIPNIETRYDNYVDEMKFHNIEPLSEIDVLKIRLRRINVLFNWIYYKRIVGF